MDINQYFKDIGYLYINTSNLIEKSICNVLDNMKEVPDKPLTIKRKLAWNEALDEFMRYENNRKINKNDLDVINWTIKKIKLYATLMYWTTKKDYYESEDNRYNLCVRFLFCYYPNVCNWEDLFYSDHRMLMDFDVSKHSMNDKNIDEFCCI